MAISLIPRLSSTQRLSINKKGNSDDEDKKKNKSKYADILSNISFTIESYWKNLYSRLKKLSISKIMSGLPSFPPGAGSHIPYLL